MKPDKPASSSSKSGAHKKLTILGAGMAVVLVVAGIVALAWQNPITNYAEEAGAPLEKALLAKGVVKQCSDGDRGRGPDNNEPWYYAIYEVPGDRDTASKLVQAAAKDSGFNLIDDSSRAVLEDNIFLADRDSKKSPYSFLKDGNIEILVDIFGSKTYYGEGARHCGVTKRDNPPQDKTTVWVTVNLPAFK